MPAPGRQELDENISFREQLGSDHEGPIVLINTFTVAPEDADAMLRTWAADSAVMKQQPGFISAQLHRGVAGSCVFVNYAVWQSAAHLRAAVANPAFLAAIEQGPASAIARPHVFQKLGVDNVCIG